MMNLPIDFLKSTLDLACTIQAIPAPTFNEVQRAAFCLDKFHEMGLSDVQRDSVGNVLARLPGSDSNARPLVVSAHIDTVHPLDTPLEIRRQDDRITGPGIGDNALGLAALFSLVQMLKLSQIALPGDLWLAANVGEEGLGDLRGIQAIVDRFAERPIAYLVLEGMGLGTILHRGLGVERYKITVHTPGGHSWVDYGEPSAIHEICRLVNRLALMPLPQKPCTTLNVGVIRGGTSVNTIASNASIELDLRSEDNTSLENLVEQIQSFARQIQRPGVRVTIEQIGKRQAGYIAEHHPLVDLARDVLTDLGLDARADIASTDANLPLSRGFPAICVGITYGNNAHTAEEFILTRPVLQGLAQIYQLVIDSWRKLGQ